MSPTDLLSARGTLKFSRGSSSCSSAVNALRSQENYRL